ncbi:response regulator containing a CheY-like receiver domain and an HTH DNA-binding domain [Rivularia sp. PCC 7116]|uniref:LuxR C-terminal-related transcriptional regulator n=1 Tax=Rivularia sp. PCC 7116 TaxID=373994 RepID=UPI00029F2805|nr:LuxR C-terminal-related transcriptional regulator [Rivularia sp. PCC 7116]AFY55600.1 response regulator containing a CheY-like receiver domain and an HTH DNA-binding domain [Rivularia sp. PCC 7116]
MPNSLQLIFEEIAQTRNKEQLRGQVMVKLGDYFQAKRRGLFFFDSISRRKTSGLVELALSIEHNPVLRYVVEHHAPVHEEVVLQPGRWKTICPRIDHGHVMAGPIIGNGKLIGGIGFTRTREASAFNTKDLADLSAVCLHLSTWLITVKSQIKQSKLNLDLDVDLDSNINCLTPREIQIAELVAQGLTNAQIGKELWIQENSVKQALKRMFRKLKVSSRAEMVAKVLTVNS